MRRSVAKWNAAFMRQKGCQKNLSCARCGKTGQRTVECRRIPFIVRQTTEPMTRQQVLDLYFMDARFRLIELAAFLDRVDRAEGQADFRLDAFRKALRELDGDKPERAKQVLLAFSDPTSEPIAKAPGKGAVGAWPGKLVE